MQQIQSIDLIATDPKVRGGRPCIAGTSLRVTDLVIAHLYHHHNPSQLAAEYDLSLAQVYAALSYYYAHKAQLDEDIRQQIAKARQYRDEGVGSRGESRIP